MRLDSCLVIGSAFLYHLLSGWSAKGRPGRVKHDEAPLLLARHPSRISFELSQNYYHVLQRFHLLGRIASTDSKIVSPPDNQIILSHHRLDNVHTNPQHRHQSTRASFISRQPKGRSRANTSSATSKQSSNGPQRLHALQELELLPMQYVGDSQGPRQLVVSEERMWASEMQQMPEKLHSSIEGLR